MKYFHNHKITIILFLIISATNNYSQKNFYEPLNIDTVKWEIEDFGRMWTFDNIPIKKFSKDYNFSPSQDWIESVQKSALQFGGGCSAAFISADGLIMTNHHCGRNQLSSVQKEGENILRDGFYAETLEDERKIENLFVDQLIFIEDITTDVKNYMEKGKTDDEKVKLGEEIKNQIIDKYNKDSNLHCKVVTLYHGGKYSLYAYKRYDDIRLVMAPDFQIAATGWDWDNFTYPRYELDFMFYRAYDENGKPVKSDNYFTWSKSGANEGEPIFVVGRPGSTDRLYSHAQLEYMRDFSYPNALIGYNKIYQAYFNYYEKHPEKEELLNDVMRWGNARKSYAGRLSGLQNKYIMKKKRDFESDLKVKVFSDSLLKQEYGHIWNSLELVISELGTYSSENTVLRFNRFLKPKYYDIASEVIKIAEQKQLPDSLREEDYKSEVLPSKIESIFPTDLDFELEDNLLKASIDFLNGVLDKEHILLSNVLQNRKDNDAVNYIKNKSKLLTREGVINFVKMDSQSILASDDPLIQYQIQIKDLSEKIRGKIKELNNTLSVLNEELGEIVYLVYGNEIPPDATSTLRISDGVIKGYEYNGTIAPGKTTYYGLWDRYESFNKKTYPWGLHERWKNPPAELDLSTDIGFASTNDIVGGNSGSSVININKEVVGLVHDGNIESLAGHTIYLEENNRTVATDATGLLEALKYIYKTDRLIKEIVSGRLN